MALDFDFDKLDKAIGEIMDGLNDDSVEQPKKSDNGKLANAKNSSMATAVARVNAKPTSTTSRRRPKAAMIGGRVTGKLSEKSTSNRPKVDSTYTKPGEGRFLDMVSPSSDALNQHKPNVKSAANEAVESPRVVHRAGGHSAVLPRHVAQPPRNRHQLAQPMPAPHGDGDFVSAADKTEPYVSPFLPDANKNVTKRPLGARRNYSQANQQNNMRSASSMERTHSAEQKPASSQPMTNRHGHLMDDVNLEVKESSQSKAKSILLKVLLFVAVIIAGGLIGVLCFYLFG